MIQIEKVYWIESGFNGKAGKFDDFFFSSSVEDDDNRNKSHKSTNRNAKREATGSKIYELHSWKERR